MITYTGTEPSHPIAWPLGQWVRLFGGVALLAACAPHAAPPVYALALPPVAEEPTPPMAVAAPDDVASAVGLLRGDTAPGDGLLMPAVDVAACAWDAERADYWRTLYGVCVDARATDRGLCEAEAGRRWDGWREAASEARALRWTGYGLGVAGLLVGVGVGIVAGEVAP